MTLETCLDITVFVCLFDVVPVPGMGVGLPRFVAGDADIAIGMAGLAGLEIAPCFTGMVQCP